MSGVLEAVVWLVALAMVPALILAALMRGVRGCPAPVVRLLHRPPPPAPVAAVRPIEQVASDVRRIAERYHQDGMRFAQYEGRRRAYDRVLAEAAGMLGITHLIGVLPPGVELDRERERVERLLTEVGVLSQAA